MRRESYEVLPDGQRRRMYRISENAVKQARYRVAKEARDKEAAARAWLHAEGVAFDKLSRTQRWSWPDLVHMLRFEKDGGNLEFEAGLKDHARRIRDGKL
jgi:hypothetical protein